MDRVVRGIFVDVEDYDAITFVETLFKERGMASVLITMTPEQLDKLEPWLRLDKHIAVWVRLNYGYHPRGTLPPPGTEEERRFFKQATEIIRSTRRVKGWILGNEPNNPQEWPSGKELTVEYVSDFYARVWRATPIPIWVSPPPLDPFSPYLEGGYVYLWKMISYFRRNNIRPEFWTFQAKTQLSVPALDLEWMEFGYPPLTGRSMNFGAMLEMLAYVYVRFPIRAIVISECNPQRPSEYVGDIRSDTPVGWTNDPDRQNRWVTHALRLFRLFSFFTPHIFWYVHFYRWARDAWAIKEKEGVLKAILYGA